jgi:hypothetical protein
MDEINSAEHEIARSRERIGELAEELSWRVSPTYVKGRAKEMAMYKTEQWKDQARQSPKTYGAAGAVLGWLLGGAIYKAAQRRKAQRRKYSSSEYSGSEWSSVGIADEGVIGRPGIGVTSGVDVSSSSSETSKVDQLKGRASELKARASEKVEHLKERSHGMFGRAKEKMPSRDQLKSQASSWKYRAEEQPVALMIGAIVLGSLCAWLIPVSQRERQALQPAKQKMKETFDQVTEKVEQKVEGSESATESSMGSASSSEQGSSPYSSSSIGSADYGSSPSEGASAGASTTEVEVTLEPDSSSQDLGRVH